MLVKTRTSKLETSWLCRLVLSINSSIPVLHLWLSSSFIQHHFSMYKKRLTDSTNPRYSTQSIHLPNTIPRASTKPKKRATKKKRMGKTRHRTGAGDQKRRMRRTAWSILVENIEYIYTSHQNTFPQPLPHLPEAISLSCRVHTGRLQIQFPVQCGARLFPGMQRLSRSAAPYI